MLRQSLLPFFFSMEKRDKAIALRAVSHFVLFGSYKEYRNRIKLLPKDSYTVFYTEVRNFLKSSFECKKVWRAVRDSLSSGSSFEDSANKYNADLDAMLLFWKALSDEDKTSLSASLSAEDCYDFLTKKELTDLTSRLDKYCGKVAYLRLRFLADNDKSFDLADLRGELLAQGLQVVRTYEHTKNIPLIENYAKASIQNHAINLIQHFTSESRACVKNITTGCGTCIFCLTDKPQRCSQSVADYSLTTVSTEGLPVQDLGKIRYTAEDMLQARGLIETLKKDAPSPLQDLIDLVFSGSSHDEFELWLLKEHETSIDDLLSKPKKLVKLACDYFNLSQADVRKHLLSRYTTYKAQVA